MPEQDRQIAFITYETPYAPAGGVAAVMARLPGHIQKATGLNTVVVTPFHAQIQKTSALQPELEMVGRLQVPFEDSAIPVDILVLKRDGTWYLLKAQDERFFAGRRHPYDLSEDPVENAANLKRDALHFGAAAAMALHAIAPRTEWTLMMQDWEAATAALALTSYPPLAGTRQFLTLHNSYDSGATDADLLRFGIDPALCPGTTVLDRALPLVQESVFTVSDQFALDFGTEILQAKIMTPHINAELLPRLVGVNNGLFTDLAVNKTILSQARRGEFAPFVEWKAANREAAIQALERFTPTPDKPVWGDWEKFKRDEACWFVLAGRDDARQKGYDVASSAIEKFLLEGGEACFLFFPIPGDEGLTGLGFLKRLAERFSERVLVLPFIFQEGYFSALQGATYGVMPSLYEPFGMANEFYLKGTVGIGRATGGILQQIVPLRSVASFSPAVKRRADRWHDPSADPTGFLYRERDDIPTALEDWQAINVASPFPQSGDPGRVEARQHLPLFQAMAEELSRCLSDAAQVYQEQPDLYYRMLTHGIDYIQNTFSWERAAHTYARYLR